MSDQKQCECEHIAHFEKAWATPNGNPGHRAGVYFHLEALTKVSTPYGVFHVCKDCAKDCMGKPADVAAHVVQTRR